MLNKRATNLVNAMPEGFEAALIQTEVNRFYFLDFDAGDAGTVLILPDKMIYIIDSRYIELAEKQISDAEVILQVEPFEQVAEILKKENVGILSLENTISVALLEKLDEVFSDIELDSTGTLAQTIEDLRAVKDDEEIRRMQQAQKITDDCFVHILPFIKEGVSEIELALEMEFYMRSHGSHGVAFPTIFVSGANSSLPHGEPSKKKIQPGDFITMDFGAHVQGYCADMTRTVIFGKASAEQKKVYSTVLEAHLAGIDAVHAGAQCNKVDYVARSIIDEAGFKGRFGHGLGHAVGIEIHENPRFAPNNTTILKAGMMMTVEPGIYLPGKFGCRIEDTVLVTENGCNPLPNSNKELIELA